MIDSILFLAHMISLCEWNATTGAELQHLIGHTNYVISVAFSHDDIYIVSGSNDKSVRVWDAKTGAELHHFTGHTHSINSVSFSHDGTRIVSGSSDKSVRVWDTKTDAELQQLNGYTRAHHELTCRSIQIQPAGILISKILIQNHMDKFLQVTCLNGSGTCRTTDHPWITDMCRYLQVFASTYYYYYIKCIPVSEII